MSHHSNPRALLTPAMRSVIDRMARLDRLPLHALTPVQARSAYEASAGVLDLPGPKLARVQDLVIPAADGTPLCARLLAPSADPLPLVLYLHGGGFTVGSIATHEPLARRLAEQSHTAVVLLAYRLAPEHRFPTAFDDAWAALTWLWQHAGTLGLAARRLAVAGDSAGGTLAAACALQARNQAMPLALQLLFYPGTCAHQDTASHQRFGQGFVLEQAHIRYFFDHYIPDQAQRDDWRFAPVNADVSGVAPAWVGLAECDPLVDEGLAYADHLRMAGVSVDLELYRGVTHAFVQMGRAIPQASLALADAARALRLAWNR